MNKSSILFTTLKKNRLIALLTPENINQCIAAHEILNPCGITLEIALRSESALEGIKATLQQYPDALILAGTVMTSKQAEAAIQAGVAGIVSADYIESVVETCVKHDIMCIPGGLSDAGKQLAHKADLYGCSLDDLKESHPYQWIYKLFPTVTATKSNIELASAWKGPFKDLTIVYTGGITTDNLGELVRYDPDGIFCGSAVTRNVNHPEIMKQDAEEWTRIIHGRKQMKPNRIFVKSKLDGKVITFGEIMLRLSPPNHQRFVQTKSYDATFGGAEANVAVSLADFGMDSCFVTVLPDHEIGQAAVNALRPFGVDTKYILRKGDRIGIYFLEPGASQRPSKVIYDRAGSAFSGITPGQFDWNGIFQNASWFHWSGITPAVSDSAAAVTLEAVKAAKKAGITVSVDLNYRSKLWSKEKAQAIMTPLMDYVDICIGNEEDAENIFGIKADSIKVETGQLDADAYEKVAKQLIERHGFSKVAITLRQSINASVNDWSACLYNGKDSLKSKQYHIQIVDRVGSGDAFSAGLIYGILTGKSDQNALEFATAASCLKHTIPGDFNLVSVQEVEQLASGISGGRVQR